MKRFICIFPFLRAIALAAAGAAVLGVWMPGVGAYVSEDWRSNSVMSVMDFQQIDAELGSQKTLVPGVESQWIICRNDPVNYFDPDGREVVVSDAIALERIRSTVPAKLRSYITTTNSNRICEDTMRRARTSNQNFSDLMTLASDAHLITVRTGTSSDLMEFTFQTQEQVRQDIINNFPGTNPNDAIAEVHLGIVNPISDIESEVILANNDGLLSDVPAVEFAITTAHELYGHMILRISGKAWLHEDEGDGPVNQYIISVEDRTRAQFEE